MGRLLLSVKILLKRPTLVLCFDTEGIRTDPEFTKYDIHTLNKDEYSR